MICPNCGQPLPDTAKMCFSCRSKLQWAVQNNNAPVKSENVNSKTKGIKKLYILLAVAVIAMIGLFYAYKVVKGDWRLPFQKKQIVYINQKIFDYSYSVSDEWEGDGKLDEEDTTVYAFKNGKYIVQRLTFEDTLNDSIIESYIDGLSENAKTPWIREKTFYLDGRLSFITSGLFKADSITYKMKSLVTQYNGYLYTFTFAIEEKRYDSELADDVLSRIHLNGVKSYTYDNVSYSVPSKWKEDKQYEAGLHFKDTNYELTVSKRNTITSLENENAKMQLSSFYNLMYMGKNQISESILEASDVTYFDGYPGMLIEGTYKVMYFEDHTIDIFIYQIDGTDYIFEFDTNTTFGDLDDVKFIIESIHIATEDQQ